MAIEKCFSQNYINAVFDPVPSYNGYWTFSINNLFENSLKENNISKFETFYKKTYQEPLLAIFKNEGILKALPFMVSLPNPNLVGRRLCYSEKHFYMFIISLFNNHIDYYGQKPEEHRAFIDGLIKEYEKGRDAINMALIEALHSKCAKLKDALDNEFNSDYFASIRQDYDINNKGEDFSVYLKNTYDFFSSLQKGLIMLGGFFDKSIDFKELASCFDPDTFCLLFAKVIYDYCLTSESPKLPNCYTYIMYYKKAIEEIIKTDKRYDPKITYVLPSGAKIRNYSRWDFHKEYHSLLDSHPEIKEITLPNLPDNLEYRNITLMEKFNRLYDNDIALKWAMLPDGVQIKKGSFNRQNVKENTPSKNKDTLIKEINERIEVFQNSGYIGNPRMGADGFKGFFAFFYPNGVVILEKFWENEEETIPSAHAATYVMDIDNFLEMSVLPRSDILAYMRENPDLNVKRIFHTSFGYWYTSLYNAINNVKMEDKLKTVVDFMNSLGRESVK